MLKVLSNSFFFKFKTISLYGTATDPPTKFDLFQDIIAIFWNCFFTSRGYILMLDFKSLKTAFHNFGDLAVLDGLLPIITQYFHF